MSTPCDCKFDPAFIMHCYHEYKAGTLITPKGLLTHGGCMAVMLGNAMPDTQLFGSEPSMSLEEAATCLQGVCSEPLLFGAEAVPSWLTPIILEAARIIIEAILRRYLNG